MSAFANPPPNSNPLDLATGDPRVSVIIPAYKIAPFVSETLDSVLSQTFTSYEVILVNDGSPDTEELEEKLKPYGHRITYIKQANLGAGAARNAGIRAAKGEFVAFLDGDDIWLPNFLAEQLCLLESGNGYDFVYADAMNFKGTKFSRSTNMDFNPSTGPVTAQSLVTSQCNVVTSSVIARRRLIHEVGLFDINFPNSQDFDLWLRLAKLGARMNYQKKVLVHRRIYDGSLASNPINSLEGQIRVLEKAAKRDDLTDDEWVAISQTIKLRRATTEVFRGKQELAAGDYNSAITAFRVANCYYKSWKLRLVLLSLRIAPHLMRRVHQLRLRIDGWS
jgi:glycosyltransferase involved in cell wall biosynthesis